MSVFDASIRLVTLQFSYTNRKAAPPSVRWRDPETSEEHQERKSRSEGKQILAPITKCSLADFPAQLEAEGYELVDAYNQKRSNFSSTPSERKTWYMTRFRFARKDCANPREEFKKVRDQNRADLNTMVQIALWRNRIYLQGAYHYGELLAGQSALSINLEKREPLYNPDGTRVMEPIRDAEGNKIGSAPLGAEQHFRW